MEAAELAVLAGCSLFRGIDAGDIDALCDCLGGRVRHCGRGERLWLTGDAVTACGIVLRGRVRAESVGDSGRRQVTALHGPGAVFGDVLMSTPAGHSPVDVLSAGESSVLLLPYGRIMDGCAQCCPAHRRLRENLLGEIARKYWLLRRRVRILSVNSLRTRVALRLLDAAADAQSDTFSLGCSREELADMLGVNRSALSRELSRMRQAGLLDFYRDSFRLLNKAELSQLVSASTP